MIRRAFAAAGLCLLLGAASPAPPPAHPKPALASVPISRMDTPWWRQRHEEKLAELRRGPVDLVFLGDSITQNWEKNGPPAWTDFRPVWEKFYGDRHAVNLGFKGDATSHLLWRITHGEIDGIAPKVAVILIGANNLGRVHWPVEDNIRGIETVVAEVQHRLPSTQILLLGILPSERNEWASESTRAINQALAARYGNGAMPRVTYQDVTGVFMAAGKFDRSQFLDPLLTPPEPPLHPSAHAQARMAAAIEPTLARLMGDRVHPR